MTNRFARAFYKTFSDFNGVVQIKVGNGDYYELSALDCYHGETKLHEFARTNNLIIIELAGFKGGSRTENGSGLDTGRRIASPIAASRSSYQHHRTKG